MLKKIALCLLCLLVFAIPIEHKYDKPLRGVSKTLVPEGLVLPKEFNKKLYFYLSDIAAIFLAAVALFALKQPLCRFFTEDGALYLWTFFFLAFLSIIVSPLSHYLVAYSRLLQLLTPIFLFCFLSALKRHMKPSGKLPLLLITSLFSSASIQAILGIIQYFKGAPLGLRFLGEPGYPTGTFLIDSARRWIFDAFFDRTLASTTLMRASGTFAHCNVFGGFLCLSILLSYFLIVRETHLKKRLFIAFFSFLQLMALTLSFSRSALIGWAIGTTLFFFFQVKGKELKALRFLTFYLLFSVIGITALFHEQLMTRGGIINTSPISQGSNQVRLRLQASSFSTIKDHPLLGVGLEQYSLHTKQQAPHNIYLYIASETGLFSLAFFTLFLLFLLRKLLASPPDTVRSCLASSYLALLFIGGCDFYLILFQPGKLMFFTLMGLIAYYSERKTVVVPLMPLSKKESWKMFDAISPTYDPINRILSLGRDKSWRKKVAQFLPPKKEIALLDLATGTGDQIFSLFHLGCPIKSADGIDLSEKMLALAKKKGDVKPYKDKIRWSTADAANLPFQEESFDAATFSFGIRNVESPLDALKEIHRVLKKGGRCLVLEFSLPPFPIRPFYLLYLRHLLPKIGRLLSRSKGAYKYLNETIETFPSGEPFLHLLQEANFSKVKQISMALGAVSLYVGEK